MRGSVDLASIGRTIRLRMRRRLRSSAYVFDAIKTFRGYLQDKRLKKKYPSLKLKKYSRTELNTIRGKGSCSQLGQDEYIMKNIFASGFKGTFIDVGCNHPKTGNNSARLEAVGWTGHAIDPQSRFAEAWSEQRRTPFVCAAVSAKVGEREFIEFDVREGWEHELSSFTEYVSRAHLDAMPHIRRNVTTGPLAYLIPDLAEIDLVMVDVEGAEVEVLDGLDLASRRPYCLMIENNRDFDSQEALRRRVISMGYAYVARLGRTDDVFVQMS